MEQSHYKFSITTAFRSLIGIFHSKKEAVETKRHFLRLDFAKLQITAKFKKISYYE